MLTGLSQRLLTLLQLTRMALVFTAISNALCSLFLAHGLMDLPLAWPVVVSMGFISIGLYGFGMSLNDIIDHRRDRQMAAHRPIPSGRVPLPTAHVICTALGLLAVGAGAFYAFHSPAGGRSFVLLVFTALLILFYDYAGKYLVAPGLLTLGLIRFFQAAIPTPGLPLFWHPMLLFTHVAVLSAVAYWWEEKRPPLTRLHWASVFAGVGAVDLLLFGLVLSRRGPGALMLGWKLLVPLGLAGVFVLLAWRIRRHSATSRQAGQTLMLAGLLWLILYDAAFAGLYAGWRESLIILALLPVAYLSVQVMRSWSKLILISQPPDFKRVRTGPDVSK
jgi:hypothetical protein